MGCFRLLGGGDDWVADDAEDNQQQAIGADGHPEGRNLHPDAERSILPVTALKAEATLWVLGVTVAGPQAAHYGRDAGKDAEGRDE